MFCDLRLPELQQKVGGFFLNLMPQMRSLYVSYCSNHPSAVSILTDHRYTTTLCPDFTEKLYTDNW